MTRAEKTKIIESLSQQLNAASNFYLTDIADLTVERTSELRRLCFRKEVQLKVVKNTLLHKAMERSNKDLKGLYETLNGSTSIMFTETGNVPAKLIQEYRKKFKSEKPILKGAYVAESTYVGERSYWRNHRHPSITSKKCYWCIAIRRSETFWYSQNIIRKRSLNFTTNQTN
jgi:large subunit ribosomal protein L10